MNEPGLIRELSRSPLIAVVGISDDPTKPSHYVSAAMQSLGHRILPINPGLTEVLGEKAYPSLQALPVRPDLVNIFRLPKFIPALVDEMIELQLPALWLQLGIVHSGGSSKSGRTRYSGRYGSMPDD